MITKIIKTRGPSFPLVGQMNTNFSTKLKKFSIISTRQTMTIDWLRSTSPLTQVNGGVDLLLREREGVPSRPGSNNSPYKANPEVRTKYVEARTESYKRDKAKASSARQNDTREEQSKLKS